MLAAVQANLLFPAENLHYFFAQTEFNLQGSKLEAALKCESNFLTTHIINLCFYVYENVNYKWNA